MDTAIPGEQEPSNAPTTGDVGTPVGTPFTVDSNAIKGPLIDTLITARGNDGTELLSFTASGAEFDLDLPATTIFPVIVTTTGGTDSILNQDVSDIGLSLSGVLFSDDQSSVNINPFSTLMVEIATALNDVSVDQMDSILASIQLLAFGLPEGFNPVNSPMTVENSTEVLLAYEAFFEAIRRSSNTLGLTPNEIITAIAADLTDGILDGEGSTGASATAAAVFNNAGSIVMLEALSGELVIDEGGTRTKTLNSSDLNNATETVIGAQGSATSASLASTDRNIRQAIRQLNIAFFSTTDTTEQAALQAAVTALETLPTSETRNEAVIEAIRNIRTATKASIDSTITKANDTTTAQLANAGAKALLTPLAANALPQPRSDFFKASSAELTVLAVLANDPEVVDGFRELLIFRAPLNGAVIVNEDNTISYQSNAGFRGRDSFTYAVLDSQGDRGAATVTIDVNIVPTAVRDETATLGTNPVQIDVLANDLNLVDLPLSIVVSTVPTNGAVTVSSDNIITYTANAGFLGSENFAYTVTDSNGDSSTASISVQVADGGTAENRIPVVVNDTYTVLTNQEASLDVTENDLSLGDEPSTLTTSTTGNASLQVVGNTISYTPNNGFSGDDTFTYTVTDSTGDSATATVSILVNAIPVAAAKSISLSPDETATVDLLEGATGISDTPITLLIKRSPLQGSVSVNGTIATYTPTSPTGLDSFSYSLTDANGDTSVAEVSVTVNIADTNPQPVDQNLETPPNTPLVVNLTNGGTGFGNTPLTFEIITQPTNGQVSLLEGVATYTPNSGFAAGDSFEFRVTDIDLDTATATVNIFVDDDPVAVQDNIVLPVNGSIASINVLANDTGLSNTPISVTLKSGSAENGIAVDNGSGSFAFTPSTDFATTDTASSGFTYVITDGNNDVVEGTVLVFVDDDLTSVNDTNLVTGLNQLITIPVLDNDIGKGNAPLDVTITSLPTKGTATVSGNNINYTPNVGAVNLDTFSYTVTDFAPNSFTPDTSVADVEVYINDLPVAVPDGTPTEIDVSFNATSTIDVLANDTGLLNGVAAVTPTAGSNGATVANGTQVNYTPSLDFAGSDQFTYTVTDLDGDVSNTAMVSVFVDDLPVAVDDSTGVDSDMVFTFEPLANDTGKANGVASLEIVSGPSIPGSSAVVLGNLSVSYDPANGGPALDTLTYRFTDNDGDVSAPATVSIGIGFAALDDMIDVTENTTDATRIVGSEVRNIDILGNDALAGDGVLHQLDTTGLLGTAVINIDGVTVDYTPPTGAAHNSTDTFTYTLRRTGNGDISVPATATITVKSVCELGNVHCVGNMSPFNEHTEIQDAVDVAIGGDWVKIQAGTYVHNVASPSQTFVEMATSGSPGNPIVIEAFDGETVKLEGFGFPEDGTLPARNNGVLILVLGEHIEIRNLDLSLATRYCIEVRASHVLIEDNIVHDCFDDNITIGNRVDTAVNNVTVRNNEVFRSRHGTGIVISRPADPGPAEIPPTLGFISDIVVERNISYNNGRLPNHSQVLPIGGDPAGGGNSDGFAMGKQCIDELEDELDEPGEYAGIDSLCPRMTYRENIAFGNIDDGFDTTVGDGSKLVGNIAFGNGPEGERGFKFVRDLTGSIIVEGNVVFSNTDIGFETRFVDTSYYVNNTAIDHLQDAGRGHQIITRPTANLLVANNLAVSSRPNNGISFSNDGTVTALTNFTDEDDGDPLIGDKTFTDEKMTTVTLIDHIDDPTLMDRLLTDAHLPFYFVLNAAGTIDEKVQAILDEVKAALIPQPGSPLIDAGTFNANVHCPTADDDAVTPHDPDDNSCRHWTGSSPDIGAYEFGL